MTPVDEGPTEVTQDSPELLRRLEENARMLPFLWKEYEDAVFAALPQKEKQRLLDERAALRKMMEESERREKEAIDRYFSTYPSCGVPDGLFGVPKNKEQPARSGSPNLNHPRPTKYRKRKCKIGNNTDFLASSDPPKPGSQPSKRARTRAADMEPNLAQHAESQDKPVKHSVRPDERVRSAKAVGDPPSTPSNSAHKSARKPRKARPAKKAKPLTEIPLRRSAKIAAIRSRKTEPSKPITSSKGRKKRETKAGLPYAK
jgi:hypothetical protein